MRQFLKFMFASMLGTLLIGVVLIFLFVRALVAIGSSFSTASQPTTVRDGSILHLQLDQQIVDRGNKDELMPGLRSLPLAAPIADRRFGRGTDGASASRMRMPA